MEHRFWQNLCLHLGKPEYGPLQDDDDRRQELIAFLSEQFRQKPLDEWERELSDLEVCMAPIRTLAEVMQDPLFNAREMVTQTDQGTPALGVPVKLSQTPGSVRTAPAAFGENTIPLLEELGYDKSEIESLREKGVV